METTQEKKTLTQRQIFWIRFTFRIIFAMIVPLVFLVWKFNLFRIETTTTTNITFGGWGIIAILVVFFVIKAVIKYINQGLPYSMASQCLSGFTRILLPIIAIILIGYIIFNIFSDGLKEFLFVMCVLLVSETIAIPINPFPKWIHEHRKEEVENHDKKLIDSFCDEFFKRNK